MAEQPCLTRKVNAFAGVCLSVHLCLAVVSALQLPFLGSRVLPLVSGSFKQMKKNPVTQMTFISSQLGQVIYARPPVNPRRGRG